MFVNFLHDVINIGHGLLVLNAFGKAIADEEGLVLLQLKNGKHLLEGKVHSIGMVGSTAGEIRFFSAFGVSLNCRLGLLHHVVMCSLALSLLPALHSFYFIARQKYRV